MRLDNDQPVRSGGGNPQVLSGERKRAVTDNILGHSAIGVGLSVLFITKVALVLLLYNLLFYI